MKKISTIYKNGNRYYYTYFSRRFPIPKKEAQELVQNGAELIDETPTSFIKKNGYTEVALAVISYKSKTTGKLSKKITTDGAWSSGDDYETVIMRVGVTFSNKNPDSFSIKQYIEMKVAQNQGYKPTYYQISGYSGRMLFLEKDGYLLTNEGAEIIASGWRYVNKKLVFLRGFELPFKEFSNVLINNKQSTSYKFVSYFYPNGDSYDIIVNKSEKTPISYAVHSLITDANGNFISYFGTPYDGIRYNISQAEAFKMAHKTLVYIAMVVGLTIPEEVKRLYPDVVKRYEQEAPPQKTKPTLEQLLRDKGYI